MNSNNGETFGKMFSFIHYFITTQEDDKSNVNADVDYTIKGALYILNNFSHYNSHRSMTWEQDGKIILGHS